MTNKARFESERAAAAQSSEAAALFAQALAFHQAGLLTEAEALYCKLLLACPAHFDGLHMLGVIDLQRGDYQAALRRIDHALNINPRAASAHNNRGVVLFELKRLEDAVASYDKAIALAPGYLDAFINRGNALRDLKRFEEALASHDRAIELSPGNADAFNKRGTVLLEWKRHSDALTNFDRSIALQPTGHEAFNNRGIVLAEFKRFEEALESYNKAIALKPDYARAIWNRGLCRLLVGRFSEGWLDYEWRWNTDEMAPDRRNFKQPQWFGKTDIVGQTILLHTEQGYGDAIMAARYVRRVIEKGARVVLEAPAALVSMFAEIEGVSQFVTKGYPLPAFDLHCPLMSLPLAFGTTLNTIPGNCPYLSVPKSHAEMWQARLPRSGIPRIGISWAGSPDFKHDLGRSIGLRRMLPLLSRSDVQFLSIQKFLREGDAAILRDNPQITNIGDAIETFADTAGIMSTLDLVISSDTSVVHLAGALGKPVWILLQFVPDWRWLLDRDDSPWYPTARLFRQSRVDDWEGVVDEVSKEISIFTKGGGSDRP